MATWIAIILTIVLPEPAAAAPGARADGPLRYRGIERLLAKFAAEAAAEGQNR